MSFFKRVSGVTKSGQIPNCGFEVEVCAPYSIKIEQNEYDLPEFKKKKEEEYNNTKSFPYIHVFVVYFTTVGKAESIKDCLYY